MASSASSVCLSGFVTDPSDNPVVGVDLDFIVASTGVKLVTPGDNTDIDGFYNVCVLPGVYNVTFAPAVGTHLMGKQLLSIDLSSNIGLDTSIVLDLGLVISGTVTDSVGVPIGDVDLDVDRLSGGRVFTPEDNSDTLTGDYWVVVPPGDYRIRYDSPLGTNWLAVQLDSASITTDRVIDVMMASGNLLSGRVTDQSGLGLLDISVDLRQAATGRKIFLSNNETNMAGDYQVVVPDGHFGLRFSPPAGSNLIGVLNDSVSITGDMVWDQTLQTGVRFTAMVVDTAGVPIAGADIDMKLEATGQKLFTPNDKTDASGQATVAVAADIYTIQIDPPIGTLFDRLVVRGVNIRVDTSAVMVLPEVPRVVFSGRVEDVFGAGLSGVKIDLRLRPTDLKVFINDNVTKATGDFSMAVPIGEFDMYLSPPRDSRYVGRVIEQVVFAVDTAWSPLVLEEGVILQVTVEDILHSPISGADLDLHSETTLAEVFTPYDNTDAGGVARVGLPVDLYTLEVMAVDTLSYAPAVITGLNITGDTAILVTLGPPGGAPTKTISYLKQNYPNPFNTLTNIWYQVPLGGSVSIVVYNLLGQEVKILEAANLRADYYRTRWDGTDQAGYPVASGLYFYRYRHAAGSETKKMMVVQ